MKDFDIIVIGAGSGGVRLARTCASMGASVAIVEESDLGGACVNVGCVPKKLFVYGSQFSESIEDAEGFGWSIPVSEFTWKTLRENKNKEISRLNDIYGNLLEGTGVSLIKGRGEIIGENQVAVNGQKITAEYIAVVTGSWPSVPKIPGYEYIITSNEMFFLDSLPSRAVIWGGGYIGLEFAGILNGLGVDVTVINRGNQILNGFDADIRDFVADEIQKKGVRILSSTNVKEVIKTSQGVEVVLDNEGIIAADIIMAATGRHARTEGIGLEDVGVELTSSGHIGVTSGFQTSVPSIYAIGDVIGTPQLTPVALEQAMVLARNLFAGSKESLNYDLIPSAVFSQPSVGTVGLTEEEARQRGMDIETYVSNFRPMKHTMSGRDERCMMKLIVEKRSDRVIGAHMVGDDSGEIVQGIAIALQAGATKKHFDKTLGIHPTSAEEFVTMRAPTKQ